MASKQIRWKDVKEGQDIPNLVRHPTSTQLVMWAGAVDDYNPMHQDVEYAKKAGYPGPIVFGPLQFAFLENMLTDWIGEGWLKKITIRHVE
ncbi:MAG: MaoC/PaaZ C-terminal domain-containing protein, partial [Chloroflexota bacterium]